MTVEDINQVKSGLVDSGERTNVGNDGAVRESPEEKGRMDLVPTDFIVEYFYNLTDFEVREKFKKQVSMFRTIASNIEMFKSTADKLYLMAAFTTYVEWKYPDRYVDALTELAKHFGDGAKKYSEDNWKKGMPVKYYISSAERHMAKLIEGWHDEDHERAFLWNLCAAWWTCAHKKNTTTTSRMKLFVKREKNNPYNKTK